MVMVVVVMVMVAMVMTMVMAVMMMMVMMVERTGLTRAGRIAVRRWDAVRIATRGLARVAGRRRRMRRANRRDGRRGCRDPAGAHRAAGRGGDAGGG